MPTKTEGRLSSSSRHDVIDDIVEAPSAAKFASQSITSFLMDSSKTLPNRIYSSYSNIPTLFAGKSHIEHKTDNSTTVTSELRDRLHLSLPRSSSSSTMTSNDERRKELDHILKQLYDGKLLTSLNDDRPSSDVSESSIRLMSKGPITSTTTTIKSDDENKVNVPSIDLLALEDDGTTLQRELQEKELDIIHLHKEIQELQIENKLLKAKVPSGFHQNGLHSNNSEAEVFRREKDVLQNELRASQEQVAKLQQQHFQNNVVTRSNKADEVIVHQKEALEKKLKTYEKQLRTLTDDNDKFQQHFHQTERIIAQLKRENEELQQKVAETKKRNDELLYQEFNALRNDLKMLKQRNDELFEENRRLQMEQQRQQHALAWRPVSAQPQQQLQQQPPTIDIIPSSSSPLKAPNAESRRERSKPIRSESPNLSEASDSTNYLTSVTVERYNNRPLTSNQRSITINGNNHHRATRYGSTIGQEDYNRNGYQQSLSKSIDPQIHHHHQQQQHRSLKISKRSVEWDDENHHQIEGAQHRDLGQYDDHQQHGSETNNDYITSSSSNPYQTTYGLTRSVTLPEPNQRRSNLSMRQMNNDSDSQQQQQDDHHQQHQHQHHHNRRRLASVETASPKRPYAPSSIGDIRVNDLIKFSRPGGKISKGVVKYIGSLPGKTDQYLGLELDDEESKHDGVYQGQRLFQCKPNKGVFVGFSKVIMAWSGR